MIWMLDWESKTRHLIIVSIIIIGWVISVEATASNVTYLFTNLTLQLRWTAKSGMLSTTRKMGRLIRLKRLRWWLFGICRMDGNGRGLPSTTRLAKIVTWKRRACWRASTSNNAIVVPCRSNGTRLVVMIDTIRSDSGRRPLRIVDGCSSIETRWPQPAKQSQRCLIVARSAGIKRSFFLKLWRRYLYLITWVVDCVPKILVKASHGSNAEDELPINWLCNEALIVERSHANKTESCCSYWKYTEFSMETPSSLSMYWCKRWVLIKSKTCSFQSKKTAIIYKNCHFLRGRGKRFEKLPIRSIWWDHRIHSRWSNYHLIPY